MRILIAEDDIVSRKLIAKLLAPYGECHSTVDGLQAIEAFAMAIEAGRPYDLICLDVMMPKVDGIKALRTIRELENKKGICEEKRSKIILTTALGETNNVMSAIETDMEAYVNKPIDMNIMKVAMKKMRLI